MISFLATLNDANDDYFSHLYISKVSDMNKVALIEINTLPSTIPTLKMARPIIFENAKRVTFRTLHMIIIQSCTIAQQRFQKMV